MKKILLAFAILMGGTSIMPSFSIPAVAQVCDPSSPCLYTGEAKAANGFTCTITVKFDKSGNPVAEVSGKGTYYVMKSETEADKALGTHYVNVAGRKFYFNI